MTVLLVLFSLIALLVADFLVQKRKLSRAAKGVAELLPGCTNLPQGVLLAQNHMWIKTDEQGNVTLGMDQLLGRLVGKIDEIVLPPVEGHVSAINGDFTFRQGIKALRISSPVIGRVVAVNREVKKNPALLRQDAFGKGWLVRVKPYASAHPTRSLEGGEAVDWLKLQAERVRDFFAMQNPQMQLVTLQDGGVPADGLLQVFDADVWATFNEKFVSLPSNNIPKEIQPC